VSLSTSDYAGDGFRLRNFRHGEAPWQERELRTLVPLTLEVERNRDASTPLLKFPGHQYRSLHSQFGCGLRSAREERVRATCARIGVEEIHAA
jgi:hypothetical protein